MGGSRPLCAASLFPNSLELSSPKYTLSAQVNRSYAVSTFRARDLTAMEAGAGESESDVLLSSERLSNDSPVMWPDQQHFCKSNSPLLLVHLSMVCCVCSWRLQSSGK